MDPGPIVPIETEMVRSPAHPVQVEHPASAEISPQMFLHIIAHQVKVSYIQRDCQSISTDDGIDQIDRIAQRLDSKRQGIDPRSPKNLADALVALDQPCAHILGWNRPISLRSEVEDIRKGLQDPGAFNDPDDQIDR